MRNLVCLCAALILLLSNKAMAESDPDLFAAIDAQNNAFEDAFASGDGAAVAALFAEDAVLYPPGAAEVGGRIAIAEFWQGVMSTGVKGVDLITGEVQGEGDTAIEISVFEMLDADDFPITTGKYLVVWKRIDGVWYLHRDIWNDGY